MKKPKAPRLVTVTILTTITIIFWVFTGLYEIITSTPPVEVDPEILKPLNPSLDQENLNRLEGRIYFEEGETASPIVIKPLSTPIPQEEEISGEETEEDIPAEISPTIFISEQ